MTPLRPAAPSSTPSASGTGSRTVPPRLSGRQQQRIACARALVSRPAIGFADEPTGNLDSHASAAILSFLRRSVDEFGQSIVMQSHDPCAASYADRVVFCPTASSSTTSRGEDDELVVNRVLRLTGPAMFLSEGQVSRSVTEHVHCVVAVTTSCRPTNR